MFTTTREMHDRSVRIYEEAMRWMIESLAKIVMEYEKDWQMYDFFINKYMHDWHCHSFFAPMSIQHNIYIGSSYGRPMMYIGSRTDVDYIVSDGITNCDSIWNFICGELIYELSEFIQRGYIDGEDIDVLRKKIIDDIIQIAKKLNRKRHSRRAKRKNGQ
jgi:hypothetical protein